MRRSKLVERANTEDEDEELDSWGSSEEGLFSSKYKAWNLFKVLFTKCTID